MIEIFKRVAARIETFRNEWALLGHLRKDDQGAAALAFIETLPEQEIARIAQVPDAVLMTTINTDNPVLLNKIIDLFADGDRNTLIKRIMLGTHIATNYTFSDVLDFALEAGAQKISEALVRDRNVRVTYLHFQKARQSRAPDNLVALIDARIQCDYQILTGTGPAPEKK